MEKEFNDYLEKIEMTKTYCKRVAEIYNFYELVCPETIQDLFVTERVNEENLREYENLWFFTENYMMEAKNFIKDDNFDMDYIKEKISRWNIQKKEFDFEEANEKSRMTLMVMMEYPITANFKASKRNCEKLKYIFIKYFKPNFEKIQ